MNMRDFFAQCSAKLRHLYETDMFYTWRGLKINRFLLIYHLGKPYAEGGANDDYYIISR